MSCMTGARHAMLTWNEENALATGVKGDPNRGVTELGKQAIKKLQEKKMILDVSHINEKSFWDVIDLATANILYSGISFQCEGTGKRSKKPDR